MLSSNQLHGVPFTVICIRTVNEAESGANVIAVSCVRVINFAIAEKQHFVLKPENPLPEEFIHQLGIYDATLKDQALLADALPEIAAFVGRDIIVWPKKPLRNNAVYRYLRLTQPPDRQLYLQNLAEKTLPELTQHSPTILAQHFQIQIEATHLQNRLGRLAAEPAIQSARILVALLERLNTRQNLQTLDHLLDFCPPPKAIQQRGRKNLPFDREKLRQYPTQPGVYFMKNRLGEILYIGKAKNLRNRLRSYFQKQQHLPPKIGTMMKQVAIIDVTIVGSELEALLLEAELIKRHQPYFNRKIKDFQRMVYMKISVGDAFPRVSMSHETDEPEAAYFGPFARKSALGYAMEALSRVFRLRSCSDRDFAEHQETPCMQYQLSLCSGSCAGLIEQKLYLDSVQDLIRYLAQQPSNAIDELIAKREGYVEALLFEKAGAIQECLDLLERLQLKSYQLHSAIENHHCLLVLPDADPQAHRILSVIQGQPWQWRTFDPKRNTAIDLWEMIDTAMAEMADQMLKREQAKGKTHIAKILYEESRLISRWLQNYDETEGWVVLLKHKSRERIFGELALKIAPELVLDQDSCAMQDTVSDEAWLWEQSQYPSGY